MLLRDRHGVGRGVGRRTGFGASVVAPKVCVYQRRVSETGQKRRMSRVRETGALRHSQVRASSVWESGALSGTGSPVSDLEVQSGTASQVLACLAPQSGRAYQEDPWDGECLPWAPPSSLCRRWRPRTGGPGKGRCVSCLRMRCSSEDREHSARHSGSSVNGRSNNMNDAAWLGRAAL